MTNFARIINDVAVDVSPDPENHFHPDIAAEFEPVPDEVQAGWIRTGKNWAAPVPVPTPPVQASIEVTPVQFLLLFTSPERVKIKAARTQDPVVNDLFEILEDQRLTVVHLDSQTVKSALAYFVEKKYVTADRAAQVLAGVSPA